MKSRGSLLPLRTLGFGAVHSVSFSPDGRYLAVGGWPSAVHIVTTQGWNIVYALESFSCVHSAALSPDGTLLASGSLDHSVKLWNVTLGRELRAIKGHTGPVTSVAFSPAGKLLASGSSDGTVKLWAVEERERG